MTIQQSILNVANKKKVFKALDVLRATGDKYTRQYVSSNINKLVKEGQLIKSGSTAKSVYALPKNADKIHETVKLRLKREKIEEHQVFEDIINKHASARRLSENISSMFFYAFTEMLNNAIEHSGSKHVEVELQISKKTLVFTINDFGIGVFRNVMKKRKLKSEVEAMQDLLKGKTTTQPHSHTGEGIFFTSKIADIFELDSFGYKLRIDNKIPDVFFQETIKTKKGTRVKFVLDLGSQKHLNDVFSEYVTKPEEPEFDKTKILVRLYTQGTVYISRSQARRILSGLEKYKVIILDFSKVTTIGQAFADEIFRVFETLHPNIKVEPINMAEPVKFMIDRVGKD